MLDCSALHMYHLDVAAGKKPVLINYTIVPKPWESNIPKIVTEQ